MTVWKYELKLGLTELSLPLGMKPLYARAQGNTLQLYVLVRSTAALTRRKFVTLYTGDNVPDSSVYVCSLATYNGRTLHVFEVY